MSRVVYIQQVPSQTQSPAHVAQVTAQHQQVFTVMKDFIAALNSQAVLQMDLLPAILYAHVVQAHLAL